MAEKASHKDDGKPQLSLIDPLFIREVGKALTIPTASGKYSPHNWRDGIEVSRLLNSTMRHVNDFNDGIDNDEETGVSHLAHAACNLMFALRMLKDRPDLDDRYKPKVKEVDRTEINKMFEMRSDRVPVRDADGWVTCPTGYRYSLELECYVPK